MPANPDSILDTVKKALGLDSTDTSFDLDVTMFINSAFGALKQLGVGSDTGFMVSDNTTLWSQYISGLAYLGMVKNYVYMFVKLAFDPPLTSFGIAAVEKLVEELGWRINHAVELENPPIDPFGATMPASNYVAKAYFAPAVVQLAFASTVTPDASVGNMFYLTMTANCTINPPVSGADGQHITLEITSNGHTATWASGWDFGDAGAPVLSGAGKVDIVSAYYREAAAAWRAGFTSGF